MLRSSVSQSKMATRPKPSDISFKITFLTLSKKRKKETDPYHERKNRLVVQVVGEISTLLLYFLYSEHIGRKRVEDEVR